MGRDTHLYFTFIYSRQFRPVPFLVVTIMGNILEKGIHSSNFVCLLANKIT